LHIGFPIPTLDFLEGMAQAFKYLPIALPFGLLTVIGGINVTESARVAGDNFDTREILLAEAISTLVAGVCEVSRSRRHISVSPLSNRWEAVRIYVVDPACSSASRHARLRQFHRRTYTPRSHCADPGVSWHWEIICQASSHAAAPCGLRWLSRFFRSVAGWYDRLSNPEKRESHRRRMALRRRDESLAMNLQCHEHQDRRNDCAGYKFDEKLT